MEKKQRAKIPEQSTPPIQEEPEPVSNVLQGDDILALAIKTENLKKQHIPRFIETADKSDITQKFLIRKVKPEGPGRKVRHFVAHPATPDATTRPLDYSGPRESFYSGDQILPHHILGSLHDFRRIAVAQGNMELAELIHTPPCLMTLDSAAEEPKQEAPKEEKPPPWAPPPQHNFMKNWQRNLALWKRQQEALSRLLKKPVGELLMHIGETYRQIQEDRAVIDRILPTQHDGKCSEESSGFWSRLEYLGDEMRGLVITKTKSQRGLLEPITRIRKPYSIQEEMGLLARKDARYRYTWDRSLFLIYRRKELQHIMANLGFSQQDIDGLEVVGRGQPFSTVTVKDFLVFEKSERSSSGDIRNSGRSGCSDSVTSSTVCPRTSRWQEGSRTRLSSGGADDAPGEGRAGSHRWGLHVTRRWQPRGKRTIGFPYSDLRTHYPEAAPMPILGPSLLFCGKPACWIRGSNPQDKKQIGIAVRLTFETVEREKTSSELTVVNNGTVAIWYDWRRQVQPDAFQDLKRNRTQQFYFNNREGVILPGETKTFTFFFKSVNAGIFWEFWEFVTHPTLLGGAILQVNLHAVSLAQDIYRDERTLLEKELASHEAVTIAQSMLQELLGGILTPERVPSPVDAYLTEEDLFYHRNPQLHYQHQVVQNLHILWHQYMVLPYKAEEGRPKDDEQAGARAWAARTQPGYLSKSPVQVDSLTYPKGSALEPQQENAYVKESQDGSRPQRVRVGAKTSPWKSIMEKILVEGSRDWDSTKSWEQAGLPPPEWNLCLEDFREEVMMLPEENQREDALIRLNRAALELCQGQRPLQSDFLYQMCFQLWRDLIDGLVSHSLWLRALLGLPEKETVYLDVPEELARKTPSAIETKVASGRAGKEDRKGAAQERKQLGVKDKEDKKAAKMPGKEAGSGTRSGPGGDTGSRGELFWSRPGTSLRGSRRRRVSPLSKQDRLNSKKQKAKDDKKLTKSSSRDRLYVEDPAPDIIVTSQEPIDPLVMEKYSQRMYMEVYGLLDTMVTDLMVLADELNPQRDDEQPLRPCT
ncbi:MYCBP-associated protein [Myotis lucifugus]|uniref:MYCBP-associated protein n=1 Tax=Myotis lucifugus TaxID=59463 RepID=UPI000CCC7A6E|nr:MYCBP-associated protein [Myotis lucifugus]